MAREVICDDAIQFLIGKQYECIITGLPYTKDDILFRTMVKSVLIATTDKGYSIFFSTDQRGNKQIYSKAYAIIDEAYKLNIKLVYHKIAINKRSGFHMRPGYTHILCFSKKSHIVKPFDDVIEYAPKLHKDGINMKALDIIIKWCKDRGIKTITDPFCGMGSVLAVANANAMDAIGVDIDPDLVNKSKVAIYE